MAKVIAGPGQVLDADARRFFERRLGHDFSAVRVHTGAEAEESAQGLGARAYTVGSHVVFAGGQFSPHTNEGRRLLAHELAHVVQQSGGSRAVQCKKVSTDFGAFESTLFTPHASGVEIRLMFDPDPAKVDSTKIAMVQSVKATNSAGKAYAVNPSIATRIASRGKGAGYAIDASGETNNPLYFDLPSLGAGQTLEDSPSPRNTAQVGTNTHYQFGFCFKRQTTDSEKTKQPAGLFDRPEGMAKKGAGMAFETTALAIGGADKGKYYGSVKWSYQMAGPASAPVARGQDIELASASVPTANFTVPAKLWNAGKSRGALVVNPTSPGNKRDAYVQYVGTATGQPKRLVKGTMLRQIEAIKGTTEPMIKAEVLGADGSGTGVEVLIYVADVKDSGDGTANAQLP